MDPDASEPQSPPDPKVPRAALLAVLVSALGYFVDIYDLVLFSILRVPSLRALGVAPGALTDLGGTLLNVQLAGMLLGGLAFGVLGDKKGRLTVLFGSILLYSLANLANAFVQTVPQYAVLRFVAGFGLAGELGAGVTLVSELLGRRQRGLGTTLVASVGLSGAMVAGSLAEFLFRRYGAEGWRVAYGVGGVLGLVLLVLRVGVLESGLFQRAREGAAPRGDLGQLLRPWSRCLRFLRVVCVGMPIWYVGGVLFVFAPELGRALGLREPVTGAKTILWAYTGVVLGDVLSGLLSQRTRSRKRVLGAFLVALAVTVTALLTLGGRSLGTFYALMALVGVSTGYWVVFVTTASEQFGTNLRATVTTSAPNFVRGTAIPVTLLWFALKPALGVLPATLCVGYGCIAVGLLALRGMRESFDNDLDFLEE
ncbi:MAG: MFS transporter [Deltaproteobacteria bacterium]|nr:MFS transporter [Deltaproteobacteria bacterium]